MKIELIVLFIILFSTYEVKAQQEPMYTQYMFNPVSVNPGYTGTTESLNLNTLTRLQWVGIEGSPKTFSAALHSPIGVRKIGLGLTLVTDKAGPVRNNYFTINYAYRLKLTDFLTLSMGMKSGISAYRAGLTDLYLAEQDDEAFMSNEKRTSPNFGFGFYLYSNKYYVGFSVPKLFQTDIDDQPNRANELKRHYYLIGGYVWQLNSKWVFKPSILAKAVSGAPLSSDITMQFLYKDRVWLSAMYRFGDAAGLFFNYKINTQLTLGYGYDFSLNGLSGVNSGSHELMVSYDFDGFTSNVVKSVRHF